MKLTILKNEDPNSHKKWASSCENRGVDYHVIDLTSYDWFNEVSADDADCFLLKPPGETLKYKSLFDERLYVISVIMGRRIFPTYKEVAIYENKRMLSFFLKGANIPHPDTEVFYNKQEALKFVDQCALPIVGKTAIGASGTGVSILKNRQDLKAYIEKAFGKGIRRRLGPNRKTGNISSWTKKAWSNPFFAIKKIKKYFEIYRDAQKGFVILQEFTPHDFEWRVVKIGDSWFGHQKVKDGDKASGTKGITYVNPPIELLDFCRDICDKNDFNCMAIDVFEHPSKGFVVNELQTIFGHVQEYLMKVDGVMGRYVYNEQWVFEPGDFNTNESYDLRLEHVLKELGGE